jgi:Xaa-Pro aminopeptidase
MFSKETYSGRRASLASMMKEGIILFLSNTEMPMNYPANTYHFRQDSTFLYYYGLDYAGMTGLIDLDQKADILFADDIDIEDIIWMGVQPAVKDLAAKCGISDVRPTAALAKYIEDALKAGRKIHFIPPYRDANKLKLQSLLGIALADLKAAASIDLIKAVVAMRSVKDADEIAEIEKACMIGGEMHVTAMKLARPGIYEREIAGAIEGIALSKGSGVSFPVICSIHGETLHNHYHGNLLKDGDLLLTDAGAETDMNYASDYTRTFPVNGKFSRKQKDIYNIVLKANTEAIKAIKPGIKYQEIHLMAARIIAEGLISLGLMKGDPDAAVKAGAHAMFFPHGLGHMMGLDVHDMEDLGENNVGYDENTSRIDQFGTAYLRLGRPLQPGFVLTVEPGIYFIPALIDDWKKSGKYDAYIDFDVVDEYRDFGGVRIEDDVLVTATGYKVMGPPVPKTVEEIEAIMAK